ncbi:hypothetical protein H0B56_13870 [Haloechinothrix sp. YIM 98757]|uniref:Uncharacterized protein n=1 Tax=Haloechinothrix aidingensis TaxID=2752311 RepID=A0A838ABR2_9PSEU|nr:hypothetical protein [Haloechinothrix aidingensis]MBA0126635.1 hypothetical protein [Haloechinothrix aidingensis]
MTQAPSAPELLAGLVDDAGLFPPTALNMADAVSRHRADAAAGSPVLSHRFLCPASRVDELRGHLEPGDTFHLGLIADTGADGLRSAVGAITGDERLEQAMVEFPLRVTGEEEPRAAARAAVAAVEDAGVAEDLPVYLEPVALSDVDELVAAVAGRAGTWQVGLKFRCGGATAGAFPGPEELARAVVSAARAGVTIKTTAGLHHAVRYTDPDTGFDHHGYLNLVLAVARAVAGSQAGAVADTLRSRDTPELARQARSMTSRAAGATRRALASYGSCSTAVPVTEAAELGLAGQHDERERLRVT